LPISSRDEAPFLRNVRNIALWLGNRDVLKIDMALFLTYEQNMQATIEGSCCDVGYRSSCSAEKLPCGPAKI
jgi:hypothetical protein